MGAVKKLAAQKKVVTRRGQEGSATAFKTVAPIEFLIDYIRPQISRDIATVAYWGAGRIEAVLWLTDRDVQGDFIRFRKGHSKTKRYHQVPKSGLLAQYMEGSEWPPGYLFPAKGKKGRTTQRYLYRTDAEGNRQKLKGTTYDRPVRTASGFDAALGKALERIMGDDDPGIDAQIAAIPEIQRLGRGAFFGVSSHTFRRSQAQYLFYTLDWEATEVMQITGHRSLDAFYHYIDFHGKDLVARMQAITRAVVR